MTLTWQSTPSPTCLHGTDAPTWEVPTPGRAGRRGVWWRKRVYSQEVDDGDQVAAGCREHDQERRGFGEREEVSTGNIPATAQILSFSSGGGGTSGGWRVHCPRSWGRQKAVHSRFGPAGEWLSGRLQESREEWRGEVPSRSPGTQSEMLAWLALVMGPRSGCGCVSLRGPRRQAKGDVRLISSLSCAERRRRRGLC